MLFSKITQLEINERISLFKALKKAPISLSKRLIKPHLVVANSKDIYLDDNKWKRVRKEKFISYSGDKIYLQRVLLLTEFLVRFLEFRGYTFKLDRNGETYCDINGIEIHLNFRQKTKRIKDEESKYSYNTYKYENTDVLILQMYQHSFDRKEWLDTPKTKLEDKLLHILAYIELYCENEIEEDIRREEESRLREIELAKLKEIERLKQLEKEKENQLIIDANKWNDAELLVKYLTQRKEFLIENGLFSEKEEEYFEWGMKQVNKICPLRSLINEK